MVRYLLSLLVFLAGIVLTIIASGGMTVFYGNILSFLIVGIFPLVFVGILFGFKEIGFSFSAALKKDIGKDKLIKALGFFKIYGKTIWIAGFTAILIAAITMVVALEDKSGLGPNLSMILITLLYSGIINLVIIIPFTVFIKKQLKE
jgi:hypothetical protein